MANTISNFLIGVGFQYDTQGAQEIESGIDKIGKKALQAGAVLAGAFGIKKLTSNFADAKDSLNTFATSIGETADNVFAVGNAFESQGGQIDVFMGQLESLEKLRAGFATGVSASQLAELERANIDTKPIIEATTATQAYIALANQFAAMNQQQRLNAASVLGFDAVSIKLLSQGEDTVLSLVEKFRNIRPITEDMTDNAREFNEEVHEASQNVGSLADAFANQLLPVLSDVLALFNEIFDEDRNKVIKLVKVAAEVATGTGDPKKISNETGLPEFFVKDVGLFNDDPEANTLLNDIKNSKLVQGALEIIAFELNGDVAADSLAPQVSHGVSEQIKASSVAPQAPQAPQQSDQNITVNMNLDGNVIDSRTIKVLNGQAQVAIDDLQSSTGG